MDDISRKYRMLLSTLRDTGGLIVGYSGGCDSTLLAAVAREALGEKSLCVMITFETYPRGEVEQALETAKTLHLPTVAVEESMLADGDFVANTPERCYVCKRKIFTRLFEIGKMHAFSFVADGANADDLNDERPGSRAAREMGVISPLEDAGLTKNEVRELSRRMNLPTWNKPSFACLATRIPYGTRIETVHLEQISAAEQSLTRLGFGQARVRLHGDMARIEVEAAEIPRFSSAEMRAFVTLEFKKIGFTHITLDLQGYKTGNMHTIQKLNF
jgi:uncharacterized protein